MPYVLNLWLLVLLIFWVVLETKIIQLNIVRLTKGQVYMIGKFTFCPTDCLFQRIIQALPSSYPELNLLFSILSYFYECHLVSLNYKNN